MTKYRLSAPTSNFTVKSFCLRTYLPPSSLSWKKAVFSHSELIHSYLWPSVRRYYFLSLCSTVVVFTLGFNTRVRFIYYILHNMILLDSFDKQPRTCLKVVLEVEWRGWEKCHGLWTGLGLWCFESYLMTRKDTESLNCTKLLQIIIDESEHTNCVCFCLFCFFFFFKFLEDISPFCGAADTPILDFWWCLPWVSKPGWILSLACFLTCAQQIPQIHLWCDTCWLYRGQHGSWAFLIHVPADMSVSIGGGSGAQTHDCTHAHCVCLL